MPIKDRFAAVAMTLLVWGLAGALFGALFAGAYALLLVLGLPSWLAVIAATTISAITTSAFYSAMPVALFGAMAGVLASIGYLIAADLAIKLGMIMTIAGSAGVIAGSLYAWTIQRSNLPLLQTLNGLVAGLFIGGLLALSFVLTGWKVNILIVAAITVVGVGVVFEITKRWMVSHLERWLTDFFAAPAVAGLTAAVVGASIWFIGGSLLNPDVESAIAQMTRDIPAGLLGGLLGGLFAALALEILGYHLENDH